MDRFEQQVLIGLAAFGLIKMFEEMFERPRRPEIVVVVADQDTVNDLRELADEDGDQ